MRKPGKVIDAPPHAWRELGFATLGARRRRLSASGPGEHPVKDPHWDWHTFEASRISIGPHRRTAGALFSGDRT